MSMNPRLTWTTSAIVATLALAGCTSPGADDSATPDSGISFQVVGAERVQDVFGGWEEGDGTGVTVQLTNSDYPGTFHMESAPEARAKGSDGIWYELDHISGPQGEWYDESGACEEFGINVRQGETVTCRLDFAHGDEIALAELEVLWDYDGFSETGKAAIYALPSY